MTAPKTIDISTSNVLFEEKDPVGLMPEASARRYLEALRARLHDRFPKARVFLRWSPTNTEPTDVFTVPRAEEAEEELKKIAEELREESDEWLRYDEDIRAAFAS